MVEIRPGSLRDISYVAVNMRDQDRREIEATALFGSMTEAAGLLWVQSGPEWSWTAWLDGQPVGAFGFAPQNLVYQPHLWSAWAFGTDRFKRAVPAITRFCLKEWPRLLLSEGATRVEVRSIADHDLAHRWLGGLRCRKECELKNFGVHGETFTLWAWLREDWNDVLFDTRPSS